MRALEYAPQAKADLHDIYSRILDQDPNTAALVVERIEATAERLCVFPQMGKETRKRQVWVFGGSSKSPFRITYSFNDETVTVLRVFRANRQHIQF